MPHMADPPGSLESSRIGARALDGAGRRASHGSRVAAYQTAAAAPGSQPEPERARAAASHRSITARAGDADSGREQRDERPVDLRPSAWSIEKSPGRGPRARSSRRSGRGCTRSRRRLAHGPSSGDFYPVHHPSANRRRQAPGTRARAGAGLPRRARGRRVQRPGRRPSDSRSRSRVDAMALNQPIALSGPNRPHTELIYSQITQTGRRSCNYPDPIA